MYTNKVYITLLWLSLIAISNTHATPTGFDWVDEDDTSMENIYDLSEDRPTQDERTHKEEDEPIEHTPSKKTSKKANQIPALLRNQQPTNVTLNFNIPTPQPIKNTSTSEPQEAPHIETQKAPKQTTYNCPICLEDHPHDHEIGFTCNDCNCRICKQGFDAYVESCGFKEEEDGSGQLHPGAIRYSGTDETPEDEINKIDRYQNATPELERDWDWFRINNKNYFLENGSLWRYAKDLDPNDGWRYAQHWRRVKIVRCPICYKPLMEYLEEFRI